MVESTKQVSENYLSTEKGYADDWAAYIASCHMTAEEALDYIRTTNTQEDRAAHLVDMADFSARSTFVRNGNPWVHCYEEQQKLATTDSSAFLDKMEQLFNAGPGEVPVLGKYRVGESQRTVVSVGTRVMICEEDGSDRPYLLLHLIPVEYLQNTWTFPTEFPLAEISMIVRDGSYVVQSPSLRSRTFLGFIRAYNFTDDYNAVDSLAERLLATENGLLTYKDSRRRRLLLLLLQLRRRLKHRHSRLYPRLADPAGGRGMEHRAAGMRNAFPALSHRRRVHPLHQPEPAPRRRYGRARQPGKNAVSLHHVARYPARR